MTLIINRQGRVVNNQPTEEERYLDKNPVEYDDEQLPEDYQAWLDEDPDYQKWLDELEATNYEQMRKRDEPETTVDAPF